MKLTADEASGLSGPDVLRLVQQTVELERSANAAIAEAWAERLALSGQTDAAMACRTVAAKIRDRGKAV